MGVKEVSCVSSFCILLRSAMSGTVSGFTFSSRSRDRKASGSCETKTPRLRSLPLVSTFVLSSFWYLSAARVNMR